MRVCRIILLAVLLVPLSCARPRPSGPPDNVLLADLLSRIDSADYYSTQKEASLDAQRIRLASVPEGTSERFDSLLAMCAAYYKYVADSSLSYCERALSCARRLNDDKMVTKARLRKVNILTLTGYIFEAASALDSIDRTAMDSSLFAQYYLARKNLYHSIYTGLDSKPGMRAVYVSEYEKYRDSLLAVLPESSFMSMREKERIFARSGRYSQALEINDRRLHAIPDKMSPERALALYDRYVIYHYYMGRPVDTHLDYLLESAIIDVVSANQDIASLRYVEYYLASSGALSEAKTVSDYYYATMVKLGSRSRILSGAEISMRINDDYSVLLKRQKRRIQTGLTIIVVLSLILLFILWLELQSRARIMALNKKLDLSDKAAKGYVLGFFQLYSSYISRLLALRSKININTRKGNIKYVLDLTDPDKDITNEELKQMYHNFDAAFLDIYPNFVQDFNSLLKPECRFALKPNELLNTELRIFAVIKLGITDSNKISELLHCSIKTVYNKRSEINAKLRIPKERFSSELSKI